MFAINIESSDIMEIDKGISVEGLNVRLWHWQNFETTTRLLIDDADDLDDALARIHT